MRKNIAFISILIVLFFCLSGCYFSETNLIITDAITEVESSPNVKVTIYKPVEAKNPIRVKVSVIEENTYQMTCYAYNSIIQIVDNALPEFDENITFSYQYVNSNSLMPYYLYTPSTAMDSKQNYPLVVWLHGSGEKDVGEFTFKNCGLPKVLNNWTLSGFNAYIICPQLAGKYNNGSWNNCESKAHLQRLLDSFISENNINPEKVVIMGHSLGGQGCLYMAATMPNYFKACVSLSPYIPGADMNNIQIPVIGYSEPGLSYARTMQQIWGDDCLTYINTSHGNLPNAVFNLDLDEDNKSDIMEWVFEQLKK